MDCRSLNRVIDYPARDMTITVQAGITIAELQTLLAAENQRLPVDVPHADRATLGGALAVNVSGPRRYGFGTLRDYVIGISTVNDEGQEVKAGGRVVKNVAGYDLCKLHIGALGTLGIITPGDAQAAAAARSAGAGDAGLRRGRTGGAARPAARQPHPAGVPGRAQRRGGAGRRPVGRRRRCRTRRGWWWSASRTATRR